MTRVQLGALLRKYWYLVLILFIALAAVVLFLLQTDLTPRQMLARYGYLVILIWTFLEGETIVIIAGALSRSLDLAPGFIALSAFTGSFLSDQVMFSLGKYKGKQVLEYFPKIAGKMDKAAALFKKYDTALILGFRFVYGVRNITPIMLGISGVSHKKFFCLNFIGAGVWALTFTYGGYFAGEAFTRIMEHVGHGILYLLLGGAALAGLLWYVRARRSVKHARTLAERSRDEQQADEAPAEECTNLPPTEEEPTREDHK